MTRGGTHGKPHTKRHHKKFRVFEKPNMGKHGYSMIGKLPKGFSYKNVHSTVRHSHGHHRSLGRPKSFLVGRRPASAAVNVNMANAPRRSHTSKKRASPPKKAASRKSHGPSFAAINAANKEEKEVITLQKKLGQAQARAERARRGRGAAENVNMAEVHNADAEVQKLLAQLEKLGF